jgi:hypothetical protein
LGVKCGERSIIKSDRMLEFIFYVFIPLPNGTHLNPQQTDSKKRFLRWMVCGGRKIFKSNLIKNYETTNSVESNILILEIIQQPFHKYDQTFKDSKSLKRTLQKGEESIPNISGSLVVIRHAKNIYSPCP